MKNFLKRGLSSLSCLILLGLAAWHQFHDTFLSYGGPPVPLVRQQMTG